MPDTPANILTALDQKVDANAAAVFPHTHTPDEVGAVAVWAGTAAQELNAVIQPGSLIVIYEEE